MKAELIERLRQTFHAEALACLACLQAGHAADAPDLKTLSRAAHTLKGGAALCGFLRLRDLAAHLEQQLEDACERDVFDAEERDAVGLAIAALASEIASIDGLDEDESASPRGEPRS